MSDKPTQQQVIERLAAILDKITADVAEAKRLLAIATSSEQSPVFDPNFLDDLFDEPAKNSVDKIQ